MHTPKKDPHIPAYDLGFHIASISVLCVLTNANMTESFVRKSLHYRHKNVMEFHFPLSKYAATVHQYNHSLLHKTPITDPKKQTHRFDTKAYIRILQNAHKMNHQDKVGYILPHSERTHRQNIPPKVLYLSAVLVNASEKYSKSGTSPGHDITESRKYSLMANILFYKAVRQ